MRLWGTEIQTVKALTYFKWKQKRNRVWWILYHSKSCHTHYFFGCSSHQNKLQTIFVLARFCLKWHDTHSFFSLNGCGIISNEIWLKRRPFGVCQRRPSRKLHVAVWTASECVQTEYRSLGISNFFLLQSEEWRRTGPLHVVHPGIRSPANRTLKLSLFTNVLQSKNVPNALTVRLSLANSFSFTSKLISCLLTTGSPE